MSEIPEFIPTVPDPQVKNWTDHVFVKVAVIGVIILFLMIPSMMISSLVSERSYRKFAVINEVSSKWGQRQTIAGPYITIPYFQEVKITAKEPNWVESDFSFFPKKLDIQGTLEPVIRKRSIFKVILYQSELIIQGHFDYPDLDALQIKPENIEWDKATIHLGISDLSGISEEVQIQSNDTLLHMTAATPVEISFPNGLMSRMPKALLQKEGFDFQIVLKLKGSQGLYCVPVANNTTIALSSTWPSPKFEGQFLPDTSTITPQGFSAKWTILDINRQISQFWKQDNPQNLSVTYVNVQYPTDAVSTNQTSLGVELIDPVDGYAKNERTVKYAFLLIAMTFIVYFFFEILKKQKVHPLQYGLVGAAIVIFFILLLSLSEQIGFDPAYFTSSIATVILITLYSRSIFKTKRFAAYVGGLLLLQFGFIYTILQLEDLALLAGSIALFLIIALIMYLTRNVKWSE